MCMRLRGLTERSGRGINRFERAIARVIQIGKFEFGLFEQGLADGQIFELYVLTRRHQRSLGIFERIV